jgi:hypothetical protein
MVLGMALFLSLTTAFAASYSYADLVVPGARFTTPQDINNVGTITGTYGANLFPTSGFTWNTQSGFTLFDVPDVNPTFGTESYSINDAGVVVGSVFAGCCSNVRSGFSRQTNGTTSLLPDMSLVRGINNAGYLTGLAGSPVIRATDGTETFFNVSGAAYVIPEDINNVNTVVGYTDTSGFVRFSDGSLVILQVPEALFTVATSVNDRNEVVGFYRDAAIRHHGFLWDPANGFRIIDNPASASDTILYGINNSGTIVGSYQEAFSFSQRGFLATPDAGAVPEPATFAVSAAAGLLLVATRRSKLVRRG